MGNWGKQLPTLQDKVKGGEVEKKEYEGKEGGIQCYGVSTENIRDGVAFSLSREMATDGSG